MKAARNNERNGVVFLCLYAALFYSTIFKKNLFISRKERR